MFSSLVTIVLDNKLYIANAGTSKPLLLKEQANHAYDQIDFNLHNKVAEKENRED